MFEFLVICSLISGYLGAPDSCQNDYVAPYQAPLAPDYYWRDYNGDVPDDAIEGGIDDVGNVTYVGQVLRNNSLLPATIYPGKKSALASAYGKIFYSSEHVKVLCSQRKDRFQWIPTTTRELSLLTRYYLVIGGTEVGFVLNIGRVNFEQRLVIGKVFRARGADSGLGIPKRDGTTELLGAFEVLVYNLR